MHPSHYLMILLKRHLLGLYSPKLMELDTEQLLRVGNKSNVLQKWRRLHNDSVVIHEHLMYVQLEILNILLTLSYQHTHRFAGKVT